MNFFSKLFGKKEPNCKVKKQSSEPNVISVSNEDDMMNWAMEKAKLTLHYFESCLKSPKPNQQYFSVKVKIEDDDKVEHIWLIEPNFDHDGNLFGTIGNEPIDVKNVSLNQQIGIDRNLVSDWMIIENGRLIGGYTIRAVRDNLTGSALKNFDKSLNGIIVDAGEDYFLPSNSTPEGAIIKIENAYDTDNIEEAIACKDFYKEAQLMFKKMGQDNFENDTLEQTAEVLKLSFIQSLQEHGMPKFDNVKRAFPKREKINDNHMIITEVCYYPDGGQSIQKLNTYKTENGWKVLNPED